MFFVKLLILVAAFTANVKAFTLFGDDKERAILGLWRIPEEELMLAAMSGGVGAYLGMQLFRHKTCKGSFPYTVPVLAMIQIILLCTILVVLP